MLANPKCRAYYMSNIDMKLTDRGSYFCSKAFTLYDYDAGDRVGPNRPIGVRPTVML